MLGDLGVACDVGQPADLDALFRVIFERFRRLDVAVANAGILRQDRLGMISPESVAEIFTVNLAGTLNTVQAASRLMARARRGSIVVVDLDRRHEWQRRAGRVCGVEGRRPGHRAVGREGTRAAGHPSERGGAGHDRH